MNAEHAPAPARGLPFDAPIAADGYAWWYVDAVSDDGRDGLTLIAFVGSVFSPYYAFARRRGPAAALAHCAINVALYGERARRWTMTERNASSVARTAACLAIGPSVLAWHGDCLSADIDEIAAPVPARIRGRVRIHPAMLPARGYALDAAGAHRWTPIAPVARVEVELSHPRLRWSGTGYLDGNTGVSPLERAFHGWDWSRASLRDGGAAVLYDVEPLAGAPRALALRFAPAGTIEAFTPPARAPLPPSRWRVVRATRSDGGQARVIATLEDTPFYTRSLVRAELLGEPVRAVHESLSLARFRRAWVQGLLPFRMPRRHHPPRATGPIPPDG